MTKEEILGMEAGLELDSLIAEKVMGYEKEFNKRTVICGTELFYRLWVSGNKIISPIALYQPSRDIKAAWEVVEKMRNRPGCTGCKACIEIHGTDFDNESDKPYLAFIHGQEAQGLTAPEAICKAALLVVLEEKAEAEG